MMHHRAARELFLRLKTDGLIFTTAESLTGGMIGAAMTAIPGSSDVYSGGIVSYSIDVKERLLGVAPEVISTFGVVSRETAESMAKGVLAVTASDVSVAVTGVAGPGGGSDRVPVGTVWIASARKNREGDLSVVSVCHRIRGCRQTVRRRTVVLALSFVLAHLDRK